MYEINLKIHDENDLYCRFDESCRTLNSEVADYLAGQYSKREIGDEIILKIKSDVPVSYERVSAAFRELIREHEIRAANQRHLNRGKQIWLFCIGFVFVAAAILLNGIVSAISVELISIVGSFSIWEATNVWIVENPRIRFANKTIKKLNSTKIVIEQAENSKR